MITPGRILRAIHRRTGELTDHALRRNWRLYSAYATWQFLRRHPDRDQKLLVHQMGRVGSRSLEQAVSERVQDMTVYHVHFLNDATIHRMEATLRRSSRLSGRVDLPDQFVTARWLNQKLKRAGTGSRTKWKIISVVRDPLVRHVSSFFLFFPTFFPELPRNYHCDSSNLEELARLLLDRYGEDRDHMARWFDDEVHEPFGIDVYRNPFPYDRGYQIESGPTADLLVLRLEDLERTAPVAMREFLGLEDFDVPRVNVGSRKKYGDTYRAFRAEVPLPSTLLDEVYGTRLALHFYSSEELAAFRSKWTVARDDRS